MKTALHSISKERGSVLLITLGIGVVICIALAGFLSLAQSQNRSVNRSQKWNATLVVAESGLEDGLQFINTFAASPNVPGWTNNYSADNWNRNASVYSVRRTLGSDFYDVYVTNFVNGPT